VVLADDHGLVRAGVKALLLAAGFDVVAEAEDGRQLLREVRRQHPDIALVDVSMPTLDGLEAARRIAECSPKTRVIMLSMYEDRKYAESAAASGAWAYLSKDDAPDELAGVIERVFRGERFLEAASDVDDALTSREREVLQLIAEGKKNADIAQVMNRSIHTVRNHRARLMRKLGVSSASELVEMAEDRGLLRFPASRQTHDGTPSGGRL